MRSSRFCIPRSRADYSRLEVRCEGGQPSCKTCEVYHDKCRYEKAPSIAQAIEMARRLQETEDALAELRAQGFSSPMEVRNSPSLTLPQPPPARSTTSEEPRISRGGPSAEAAKGAAQVMATSSAPPVVHADSVPTDVSASTCGRNPPETMPADLSLDENGEIRYYGPTSAVHDPPHLPACQTRAFSATVDGSARAETQSALAHLVQESSVWEEFALENVSKKTGIPRRMMANLLHLHWTWVAPMFMWVYRPGEWRILGSQYADNLADHQASFHSYVNPLPSGVL